MCSTRFVGFRRDRVASCFSAFSFSSPRNAPSWLPSTSDAPLLSLFLIRLGGTGSACLSSFRLSPSFSGKSSSPMKSRGTAYGGSNSLEACEVAASNSSEGLPSVPTMYATRKSGWWLASSKTGKTTTVATPSIPFKVDSTKGMPTLYPRSLTVSSPRPSKPSCPSGNIRPTSPELKSSALGLRFERTLCNTSWIRGGTCLKRSDVFTGSPR
mmetsp:Transcript_15529/g.33792  ORF Transcript_15529/g.33792 Transcript_15529/m.33792 type:complete len:212 (+) Transcript_15529:2116-2751(+)